MRLNFGNFYPAFPNTLKQNFCACRTLREKKGGEGGGGEEGGDTVNFQDMERKSPLGSNYFMCDRHRLVYSAARRHVGALFIEFVYISPATR